MDETTLSEYVASELRSQGDDVSVGVDDDLTMVGLDSIAFVRLVDFIERKTDLRVPPERVTLENFGTIGRITSFLESLEGK